MALAHVDLFVRPRIHTQRLDLGYVRAQLSMYRGTAHAQKDAQLQLHGLACTISGRSGDDRHKGSSRKGYRTLHDAQPVTRVAVSKRLHDEREQNRKCMVHTWVPRVTVGALVIAWHRMYQLLQNRLVTRLLALAQGARHDAVVALGRSVACRPRRAEREQMRA